MAKSSDNNTSMLIQKAKDCLNSGKKKHDEGDYLGAIDDYTEAILLDPNFAEAFHNRGCAKFSLNEYLGAIEDFDQAIRINSKLDNVFLNRGIVKIALDDNIGALADFDHFIKNSNRDDSKAFLNRGIVKGRLMDYKGAIDDFDKAVELKPNDPVIFFNRGFAKSKLGDHENAIKDYDDSIRLNPNNFEVLNNRGSSKLNIKDYHGALIDFELAEKLNNRDGVITTNRGLVKSYLGDQEGAIKDFDKAIEQNPNLVEAYISRGSAKGILGKHDEAIADYDQAILLAPYFAPAFHNRGVAKIKLGKTDEGLKDLNYAQELIKNAPYFQNIHKEVRLVSLELINIGHFDKAKIDFDSQLTCIVGKNGTGKSTILKALGLALIGKGNSNDSTLSQRTLTKLLRVWSPYPSFEIDALNTIEFDFAEKVNSGSLIKKEQDSFEKAPKGKIILNYSVDNISKSNIITLTYKEGHGVIYTEEGDFDLIRGKYPSLRYLILGFPQQHDDYKPTLELGSSPPYPIEKDILPIINDVELKRLNYFVAWVVNLERRLGGDALETFKKVVQQAFDLINEVLMEKVLDKDKPIFNFIKVASSTPPDLLVATADHPYGISIDYLSVGLKYTMGWIGFLFSRLYEAYPNVPINKIREQGAIVLFDEIDAFIHPYIQTHLLYDLKEAFPNVQFIVSSHSPLSIAGLNREQIILLEEDRAKQTVTVKESPIDTWVLGVETILRKLQNTVLKYSKEYNYNSLLQKLSDEADPVKIEEIEDKLKRIEESIEYQRD